MSQSNRRRIDQINDEWAEDNRIRLDELLEEQDRQYTLHSKYLFKFNTEKRRLREMKVNVDKLHLRMMRFYTHGALNREELEHAVKNNWPMPPEGLVPATQARKWVETNDEMISMNMELAEQNDIVEMLEYIMTALENRSYSLGHAVKIKVHNDGGR